MPTQHSLFQRVPVEVPNMSGFDMSHENCFTAYTGTLTPAMVDDLLPKDHVTLGVNAQIQTVPFATDFYGTIEAKFEAFFVPYRILYGGWQDFITSPNINNVYNSTSGASSDNQIPVTKPTLVPNYTLPSLFAQPGSLMDYLDVQVDRWRVSIAGSAGNEYFSPDEQVPYASDMSLFPLVAYHKIYDDWYRDSRIQAPLFVNTFRYWDTDTSVTSGSFAGLWTLPFVTFDATRANQYFAFDKFHDLIQRACNAFMPYQSRWAVTDAGLQEFFDYVRENSMAFVDYLISNGNLTAHGMSQAMVNSLTYLSQAFRMYGQRDPFKLHQRNWSRDYFTNSTTTPQAGNPARVAFQVNSSVSGGSASGIGTFSIAALRSANAVQHFLEVNNYAGDRYGDQIRAQFGIYPADAVTQRALYLGSTTIPVYTKSVYAQSEVDPSSINDRNPFGTVGTKFGNAQGIGSGSLVDDFTASEHGLLMVIFSLVPHAFYSTGTHKRNKRIRIGDFAFPNLAGVGDEGISLSELTGYQGAGSNAVFGYSQRYASYKFKNDTVHGLLRDGESLSAFALKRSFSGPIVPQLSSSFLEIPREFLDDVAAVDGDSSKYGCWVDAYFSYKKTSTLPAYSIPTLEDPKNTHTEMVPNGGTRL